MKKIIKKSKRSAFTLIEMIVAITVFTIFIGFSISAYLSFHRADQEALLMRTLLMEAESTMNSLSEAIKANKIAYDMYATFANGVSETIETNELYLISPDGTTLYEYIFNPDDSSITLQVFDANGTVAGFETPVFLNSQGMDITSAGFQIFPKVDPYSLENRSTDAVQFQPIVTVDLTFGTEGRVRDELSVSLHNSVTSRYYQ